MNHPMRRISIRCALLALAIFAVPQVSTAADDEVVIPGRAAKVKVAPLPEGRATLHGPLKLTKLLKQTKGIITLTLEEVSFAPDGGNEAEVYVVAAPPKGKPAKVDFANYVGSAANVEGGSREPATVQLELNDFETEDKAFTARSAFQKMDSAYLALVVKRGSVTFERAVLMVEALDEPAADAGR